MTKTKEKQPIFQGLMDEAYERWKENEGWDYKAMLANCTAEERMAVILGNLNYQVCNGGFRQWVDNGYALHLRDAVPLLEKVGTENALKVVEMLRQLDDHIDYNKEDRGWDDYWKRPEPHPYFGRDDYYEDEEDSEGEVIAESLDDGFYAINEQLLDEIEEFLAKSK